MLKFRCDGCGKKIGVPEEYAGRRVKCPKCGKAVVAREDPELSFTGLAVGHNQAVSLADSGAGAQVVAPDAAPVYSYSGPAEHVPVVPPSVSAPASVTGSSAPAPAAPTRPVPAGRAKAMRSVALAALAAALIIAAILAYAVRHAWL